MVHKHVSVARQNDDFFLAVQFVSFSANAPALYEIINIPFGFSMSSVNKKRAGRIISSSSITRRCFHQV